MTKKEKLEALLNLRNPELKMQEHIADHTLAEAILRLEMIKGEEGPEGKQGPKGDTGEQGPMGPEGKQGPVGPEGKQGTEGKAGNNGLTPIREVDYWTKEDRERIVADIQKLIPKPKDGVSPKIEDIVSELKKKPIEYKDIAGAPDLTDLPKLVAFLKAGGFRGGGSGGSTSPLTTKGDLYGFSTVNARIPVGTDGQALVADSSQPLGVKYATITSTPGGSDTQIQFNDAGTFGGDSDHTWNKTTNTETINAGNITLSKSIVKFTYEAKPSSFPTFSLIATSTGNCTNGVHRVRVSYVTANGETLAGDTSGAFVTVDATHKQISVTGIPLGTSGVVTGRNLYLSTANTVNYFRVTSGTTINDNTTTTYTINVSDATITAFSAAPKINTTAGGFYNDGTKGGQFDPLTGYFGAKGFTSDVTFGDNQFTSEVFGLGSSSAGVDSFIFGRNIANVGQNNVIFGKPAVGGGYNFGTIIGTSTYQQGQYATLVGYGSQVSADYGIVLGTQSSATAQYGIAIGYTNGVGHFGSIAIGRGISTTNSNQFMTTATDFYLSVNGGAIASVYHSADAAGGTNSATGSVGLASGKTTGNADPAEVFIQQSEQSQISGTSVNALTDTMRAYSNKRVKFFGGVDYPAIATAGSAAITYADGTFYTGYSTDGTSNRLYKLYSKKTDVDGSTYYSPLSLSFGPYIDNNSTINGDNPTGASAAITYGIGTGSYLTSGAVREYKVVAYAQVNGVSVYSVSPATAYTSDDNHQVTPGEATLVTATQQSGGYYTPASGDTWDYYIYAHAVYNGVDIYSYGAFCTVTLDNITDPYQVEITFTDATFPTGSTVTDYTITKQINGGGYNLYVQGIATGGSFIDSDAGIFTSGTPTITPNSTPDPYKVDITWTDPTFNVATDPGTRGIELIRQVNGGGYTQSLTVAAGVQAYSDTSDGPWTGTPVTTPTTVQNYYQIPFTWTPATGAVGYKMLYSPNNLTPITTNTPTSSTPASQVDGSGMYFADGHTTSYKLYAYQVISGVTVFCNSFTSFSLTDNNDASNYSIQLDWNANSFSPYASSTGYLLQREISGGGYTDYQDVGNVITFLDSGSGWITGTPTLTPYSGIYTIATDISGGGTASFTDTGSLPWSASTTVTPSSSTPTTVTLNPIGAGIDVNGNYQLTSLAPAAAGYVQVSRGGTNAVTEWVDVKNYVLVAGTYSATGTATTSFTVTIGETLPSIFYKVSITPTSSTAASLFYISSRNTVSFTVTFLSARTGSVDFDWAVFK